MIRIIIIGIIILLFPWPCYRFYFRLELDNQTQENPEMPVSASQSISICCCRRRRCCLVHRFDSA